jgi:hypothetical protein
MKKYLIFILNWKKLIYNVRIRILKLMIYLVITMFFVVFCAESFSKI